MNAAMPPRPRVSSPVPGIADLASLAMRRLWERLEAGEAAGQARERASRAHADQVSVGVPAFAFLLGWADRCRAPRRPRHPESHRR